MKKMLLNRYSMKLLGIPVALSLCAISAHGAMVVSVSSVSVAAGTNGAALNINIQNTGPSSQNIDAFSLGVSVGDNHITFTSANISTSLVYLFNADSLFGPTISTIPPPNGQAVLASDVSLSSGNTMASSTTLGLAHLLFNVAANTSAGAIAVTISPNCNTANACTSLSNLAGANVPFTVTNGTITVTTSSTPEPSTFLLGLAGLPLLALLRKRIA